MKKRILFLLCICVTSCTKHQSIQTPLCIDLTNATEELYETSAIFDDLTIVKLETNEHCILSQIKQLQCSATEIFLTDIFSQQVCVFDKESGKFLRSLNKQGDTYREYSIITDFIVDDVTNTIEIYDCQLKKLIIYDATHLTHIRTIDLELTFGFKFFKLGDEYVFETHEASNIIAGERTNSAIVVYNTKTQKTRALFDKKLSSNDNSNIEYRSVLSRNSDGSLLASSMLDPYTYKISLGGDIDTVASFICKGNLPQKIAQLSTNKEKLEFINSNAESNNIISAGVVWYNDSIQIMRYMRGMRYCSCIFKNGEQKCFMTLVNDFEDFPNVEFIPSFLIGSQIIVSCMPEMMTDDMLQSLDISIDNNPILLFYSL